MILWLLACAAEVDYADAQALVPLAIPIRDRDLIYEVTGMDHDGESGSGDLIDRATCVAYDGTPFPSCYGGHQGNDFLLDGGFEAMDAGSTAVLAAAGGEVISTHDGEYDRCHWDIEELAVSCDGHPKRANHVILRHWDGTISQYWHLMKDSVAVQVGDAVSCGDVLAFMGSSGNSSFPHLHFQVEMREEAVDPYAGPYSQSLSLWREQDAGDGLPASCD